MLADEKPDGGASERSCAVSRFAPHRRHPCRTTWSDSASSGLLEVADDSEFRVRAVDKGRTIRSTRRAVRSSGGSRAI